MVVDKKNEASKVLCNGNHLIGKVYQCPQHEFLMCRKCCFPPEVIIPDTCPDHKTQVFHDKLAGRLIHTQRVKCPANETFNADCPWSGQYNQVTSHLDDCTFVPGFARVAMQNAMLKEADQRAEQKYEKLERETAYQIDLIKRESDAQLTAMELSFNQKSLSMMEKIYQLETMLKNMPAQLAESQVTTTASAVAHEASSATPIEKEYPAFYDGTLYWKITDWSSQLHSAKLRPSNPNAYINSPPFYTSKCGYKMRMRLYPNGDGQGKNTYVSIFLQIMKGKFDAILAWPFPEKKVTIMLLDQSNVEHHTDSFLCDSSSDSFERPQQKWNRAAGCPLFIRQEALKNHAYLRDDTMFIKVVVDPD